MIPSGRGHSLSPAAEFDYFEITLMLRSFYKIYEKYALIVVDSSKQHITYLFCTSVANLINVSLPSRESKSRSSGLRFNLR
jgi:hypothetical protein